MHHVGGLLEGSASDRGVDTEGGKDGEEEEGGGVEMTKLVVTHGHASHQIVVPKGAPILSVMGAVQKVTNVHPRGQKLIYKGKVLTPDMTLTTAKVREGGKILLLATAGVHQGPTEPSAPWKRLAPTSATPAPSTLQRARDPRPTEGDMRQRKVVWSKTGVVSLRSAGFAVLPDEVWEVGEAARILDVGGNALAELPSKISVLLNLKRLRLSENRLMDAGMAWEPLCSLRQLTILALDHNTLTQLPESLGELRSLKRLVVSHNALSSLPDVFANFHDLERLDVRSNRLKSVPESLGSCNSLAELDMSANFLKSIPVSIGNLKALKILLLDNNAVECVPSQVFWGCVSLFTLSLHGNPITVEKLRETEGWELFEERRQSKYTRQMDFQVMGSTTGFDEGTDDQQWQRW